MIILLFLFFSAAAVPQTKYLIYFKDKGIRPGETLSKSSDYYVKALESLSERSIERRKKVLGEEIINYEDVQINQDFINRLINLNISIENELAWFNAVSAYLSSEQISRVQELPFVSKVEPVKIFKYRKEL